jgi:mannose-6-phosphate isomerase
VVDVRPLELGPNQLRRFYRGGSRIASFRGLPATGDDAPEDWVASTTTVFGDDDLGRSRLETGALLGDVLAADPPAFFEPAHLARFGSEPAILLKLLDAGERLPLHFHPDGSFARSRLAQPRGKTEAWIVLEAEPDAAVWVGFSRELDATELAETVAEQDVAVLIASMNRVPVRSGDSIFVPAGVPHVIGEGILLLELQEPSDLSLLLEWEGRVPESQALLGLSLEVALGAVVRSPADIEHLTSRRGASLFPAEAEAFFRADVLSGGTTLEPAFSVLVGYEGEGGLVTESSDQVVVRRGSTVLVPFGAGAAELTGSCRVVRCRPPIP